MNLRSWCIFASLSMAAAACSSAEEKKRSAAPFEDLDVGLLDDSSPTSDSVGPDAGVDGSVDGFGDSTAVVDGDSGRVDGLDAATDSAGDADSGPALIAWSAGVYANSSSTLYRLNPTTSALSEVGPFMSAAGGAIADMTDIALDSRGIMFGVSFGRLYRVELVASTVSCTKLATLSTDFAGLTVVPVGVLDATSEVLVAVTADGAWTRVDIVSGDPAAKLTRLGFYGAWSSGGDVVGVAGGTYASVYKEGADDHLVLVDATTGAVTKDIGDTGLKRIRGLGFWAGVIYAFTSGGGVYKLDPATAASTVVSSAVSPVGGWVGAGVTTSAPAK